MSDIVPFGKYKGKPIEQMAADQGYRDWVMAQDWFRERFARLYAMMSAIQAPSETPEHNRLQSRFLDEDFCIRVVTAYRRGKNPILANKELYVNAMAELPAAIDAWNVAAAECEMELAAEAQRVEDQRFSFALQEFERRAKGSADGFYRPTHHVVTAYQPPKCELIDDSGEILIRPEFEVDGADVEILITGGHRLRIVNGEQTVGRWSIARKIKFESPVDLPERIDIDLRIELKPTMGDEYPAVLRQASAARCRCVLIGEYIGAGASYDDVVAIFQTKSIKLIRLSDVSAVILVNGGSQ